MTKNLFNFYHKIMVLKLYNSNNIMQSHYQFYHNIIYFKKINKTKIT